jgi:uncharacterized OB-fold protein
MSDGRSGGGGVVLAPMPWGDADEFWQATAAGVLRVQRCTETRRLLFPPVATSPWGARKEPEWITVSGRGRIWSFIVPHPPLFAQFAEAAPYVVVVVELEEDPNCRLIGPLVESPGAALGSVPASDVSIGCAVVVDLTAQPTGGFVVPRWVLVS